MADLGVNLGEYEALVQKADAFAQEVHARREEDLSCRAGCDSCCHVELLLSPVEAASVGRHLEGLDAEARRAIALRAGKTPAEGGAPPLLEGQHRSGALLPMNAQRVDTQRRCAMLDERGQCSIYSARPLVCRTQGLPLRYVEVAWCGLNFNERPPNPEDVLDAERINTILAVVNLRWARQQNVDPLARVALRSLGISDL